MHNWVHELASRRFPKGSRSQGGQDGILAEIFRHVPTTNDPPFCVEFGFDAAVLDGGTGANVATLVLDRGWRALLLDGAHENPAINLRREFLTSSNIVGVFAKWNVPARPDYVSIDVDSTDLWLFRALLPHYRAARATCRPHLRADAWPFWLTRTWKRFRACVGGWRAPQDQLRRQGDA
jgi:hypothetical protein